MARTVDDWIENYLKMVENTEPALSFKRWVAISCIAAVMKRKCYLDFGTETFFPNMYIVLVGPSGSRKGTAMRPGYSMLRELGVRLAAEATTRESLIRELNKSSDTNIDTLTGKMQLHSSLTIYSQEFSVFLGYNNTQLMSDLTDWYDCREQWKYSTKNEKLSDDITNVWVNLIGATTPSLIQSTLPQDAIGGGLTSRMVFIYELHKGSVVLIPTLNEQQVKLRQLLIHDLEQISMLSGAFKCSQQFIEAYVPWRLEQESNPPFEGNDRLEGYTERRPNHLLKLSIIMSASRSDDKVLTSVDFERAAELLFDAEQRMPLVFSGVGRNPNARLINKVLALMSGKQKLSVSDIYTRLSNDADGRTIGAVLDHLQSMKAVKLINASELVPWELEKVVSQLSKS